MPRLFVVLLVLLLAAPAAVAAPLPCDPPFANGYWSGFLDFWVGWFKNRNAVLLTVLIVGAVAIFIITRGKRLK